MINEATVNAFAARQLRALRTTTGLSQTKLARELGMSPQQVQKYEWGINRMSVGRVMQFAEAFDVPVATFFPAAHPSQPQTPAPPPTLRFIRLLSKIAPSDYDQLYVAMKAIAKLAERGAHDND